MRIVLATAFPADPHTPRGGVESVSVTLASSLSHEPGCDVHVVTADRGCAHPVSTAWNGVQVHRLPWTARRVLSGATGGEARRLRDYIATLEPDVVHAHDTYGIMLQSLALPRVLTIHGFIYADTRVSGERLARLRSRVWRHIETKAWSRYPHIISISPYVRERLIGIVNGVVHDIENPIDGSFFDVDHVEHGLRVFSAASISPRKNTLLLVDAFARATADLPEATLRLAGPEPHPEYADAVRRRIQQPDLLGRVTLLRSLSIADVGRELGQASVSALVSVEENAPLAVQEALAVGVPVVTSNRCGMPYQVRDGETGFLVDPLDVKDVAARLACLLRDASRRRAFGTRARTIARERFHPAVVARLTRDVYAQALAASTARPRAQRPSSESRAAAGVGARPQD